MLRRPEISMRGCSCGDCEMRMIRMWHGLEFDRLGRFCAVWSVGLVLQPMVWWGAGVLVLMFLGQGHAMVRLEHDVLGASCI